MELTPDQQHLLEAGRWTGRQQAFAMIAGKCAAAKAVAIKELRESRAHEALGLTWEEFCPLHLGVSRSLADDIIRRYNELGADYFRLAELARVTPETYQALAPLIAHDAIELDGETIPLTPQNAPRIRAGIRAIQTELRRALDRDQLRLGDYFHRIDRLAKDIYHYGKLRDDEITRHSLVTVARHAAEEFRSLQKHLESLCPPEPPSNPEL